MKQIIAVAIILLCTGSASAQDPSAVMQELLRRQMQEYEQQHRNTMMRLEIERRQLQQQLQSGPPSATPPNVRFSDFSDSSNALSETEPTIRQEAPGGPATAQKEQVSNFCLTDAELKEVAVGAALRSMGAIVGTCARRFPDLREKSGALFEQFIASYKDKMKYNNEMTSQAFRKQGRTIAMRYEIYENAQAATINVTEQYSHVQCMKALRGIEAMAIAQDFSTIEMGARLTMAIGTLRATIPKC
jgi:hypothetical protein